MPLDQFEFPRLAQRLVPLIVPWLRELRANNNDARVTAKSLFDSTARVGLNGRFALTEGGVAVSDFNTCVDIAMLSL